MLQPLAERTPMTLRIVTQQQKITTSLAISEIGYRETCQIKISLREGLNESCQTTPNPLNPGATIGDADPQVLKSQQFPTITINPGRRWVGLSLFSVLIHVFSLTLDFPSASIKCSTYVTSPTTNQIPETTHTKGREAERTMGVQSRHTSRLVTAGSD